MCPSDTQTATRRPASNKRTTADSTPHAAPIAVLAMDDTWQTGSSMSTGSATMAFKNEVVSDADIDRYKLPFPKGEGRWWTRDVERDYYLWGGLVGNLAYDEMQEGRFNLYVDGVLYWVKLHPGNGSRSLSETPYIVEWKSIGRIQPPIADGDRQLQVIDTLKEALVVYGYDGHNDNWLKAIRVQFGF